MRPIRHMKKVVVISRAAARPHPVAGRRGREQRQRHRGHLRATCASSPRCSRSSRTSTWTRSRRRTSSTTRSRARCAALDPHSSFLDPESTGRCRSRPAGASAGSASRSRCGTTCSPWWRPSRARPAYRAGIQPGDRIVKIEGLVHQGHAAPRRGQAHARQARHEDHDHDRARGLGRSRRTSTSRASRSACSRSAASRARAGHRVHQAAPVPGADRPTTWAALDKYAKDGKIQGARASTCATTRAACSPPRWR